MGRRTTVTEMTTPSGVRAYGPHSAPGPTRCHPCRVPEVDLVDATWIAAPPAAVAAVVGNAANWATWWPGMTLTVERTRGVLGVQWRVHRCREFARTEMTGSMEIWLEPAYEGVVLHYFLRLDPTAGRIRRAARCGLSAGMPSATSATSGRSRTNSKPGAGSVWAMTDSSTQSITINAAAGGGHGGDRGLRDIPRVGRIRSRRPKSLDRSAGAAANRCLRDRASIFKDTYELEYMWTDDERRGDGTWSRARCRSRRRFLHPDRPRRRRAPR